MSDIDEWSQIILLNLLLRYARLNFEKPQSLKRRPGTAATKTTQIQNEANHSADETKKATSSSSSASTSQSSKKQSKKKPQISLDDFYGEDSDEDSSVSVEEQKSNDTDSDEQPNTQTDTNLLDFGSPAPASKPEPTEALLDLPTVAEEESAKEPKKGMDEDLKLLLASAVKLMKSRNAGVLLSVTKV